MPDKFGNCVECQGRYLVTKTCPACGSSQGWKNIGAATLGSTGTVASSPENPSIDEPVMAGETLTPNAKNPRRSSK